MIDQSDPAGDSAPVTDEAVNGQRDVSGVDSGDDQKQTPGDTKLVQHVLERIRRDKRHFEKAMKRMERSMFMAMWGRERDWSEKNYKANLAGQHVRTKTSSLYAKNPKIVARRKESLDFPVWDESLETLKIAMMTMAAGAQAIAVAQAAQPPAPQPDPSQSGAFAPPGAGPNGGPPMPAAVPAAPAMDGATLAPPGIGIGAPMPFVAAPALPPGYDQAVAIVKDFEQGTARRQLLKKFGRTLELVFADSMRQQTPLDFKSAMKRVVRRSLTTATGYVELGFQRQYGIPNATTERLADYRQRLAHLEGLIKEESEGELDDDSFEKAELQQMVAAIESEPQTILRSGLSFDFMQSTKVIPDRLCTSIVGFIGARHLTVEYIYTKSEVEDMFKVDLGSRYTPYLPDGRRAYGNRGVDEGNDLESNTDGVFAAQGKGDDLVCVYKHYDKVAGLVYHLVDGHPSYIKPPAAPDVIIPRFWPVYSLTFNDTESETDAIPRSDVEQIADMQNEVNRSRQGKREHREAARPRFAYSDGALDEETDIPNLKAAKAFDVFALKGLQPGDKVENLLQAIKMPGVDPNLYDTNEVLQDASMTVGAQASQLGGTQARATATGVAVANDTSSSLDSSSTDDLDGFLTMIARDAGQILMENLTKEEVVKIAGAGAIWTDDLGMDLEDIFNEIFLEVEAGSTGKPNQAAEIRSMQQMGPLLLQVGSIPSEWLAREMLRRLDDRLDLTEAVSAGVPAMVAANAMAQPAQGNPQKDPNQQGGQGGDKTSAPGGPSGTHAPMGNNHTPAV